MLYYIGLMRPSDDWPGLTPDDGKTLIAYLCRDKDYLPTDLRWYLGPRVTTKEHWRENKAGILAVLNTQHNTTFTQLIVR